MSTFRRLPLSRRTFLRGAGATLAIPFLEAMSPRIASAQGMMGDVPRRLLVYYVPNGMHMPEFTPDAAGAAWMPKRILQPVAHLKQHMLMLTGLENKAGWADGDGPGDHARGTGTFITARRIRKTNGTDIRNGVSFDQVVADSIKELTRLPSLQLGMEGGGATGDCDSGYSCAYAHNISWADEQTPLPKMTNPRHIFDYILGGFDPSQSAEAVARRRAYQKSVLDYVAQDTAALQRQLGATDKAKLDQYMTGLRELERKVEVDHQGAVCDPPDRPDSNPTSFASRAQAMADLMVTAFECDMTRVISFMLDNAGGYRNYQNEPGVLVSGGHHQISHHENKTENFEALTKIGTWEVAQLAYLLDRLQERTDVDGNTLLHNSTVLFSSEISDGDRHNHDELPVILAGHGGGLIKSGEHLRLPDKTPIANLFLSLIQNMRVPALAFGADSTGPLSAIHV